MPLGQIFVKGKIGEKFQKGIDMLTDTATGGSKDSDADIGEIDSININSADSHTSSEEFKMDKSKYYDVYPQGKTDGYTVYRNGKEDISNYINYLNENYLTDFTPEEIVEIMSMDYDDAMEYIDNSILDIAYAKAEIYSENFGIPVTDELIELLQLPNAESSEQFLDYMDQHFSEFKDNYIDYYMNLKMPSSTDETVDGDLTVTESETNDFEESEEQNFMKFTDEQKQHLMEISSYREMQEYMAEIAVEATARPLCIQQAIEEAEKRCYAYTGYSAEDVYSGKAAEALQYLIENPKYEYTDNNNSYKKDVSTTDAKRKLKFCEELVDYINQRTDFLVDCYVLESSPELANVELYGNIGSTDNIKFYYKDREVINWNPETLEITVREKTSTSWVEKTEQITIDPMQPSGCGMWISDDWKMVGNFGKGNEVITISNDISVINDILVTDDAFGDSYHYNDKYNIAAIFNLYADCGDSSNYKDQLFRAFVDDSFFHYGYDDKAILIFPMMTLQERQIYTLKYNESAEAADEYLDNLMGGLDFRKRESNELFMAAMEEFGGAKKVDYSDLTEISEEKYAEIKDDTSISTIGVYDEFGLPHYYLGKEDTMYIPYEKDGSFAWYEVHVDDSWGNSIATWPAMIIDKAFMGAANRLVGAAKAFSVPEADYTVEELLSMSMSQFYSMYKGGKFVCSVSEGVGGAIPLMMLGSIPYVGPYVSGAVSGLSHYGNLKEQTVKQGYTLYQAEDYAMNAAVFYTLEDIFTRGIPGFSRVGKLAEKYYSIALAKAFAGGMGRYAIDKVLRDEYLDESLDENFRVGDMFFQGATAMFVTAVLRLPGTIKKTGRMTKKEELKNNYELTDEQAARVRRLQYYENLSEEDAVGAALLMGRKLDNGEYISKADAIVMQNMINRGIFANSDAAIEMCNVAKNDGSSIQQMALIQLCQQQSETPIDSDMRAQILKLNGDEALNMFGMIKQGVVTSNEEILNICSTANYEDVSVFHAALINLRQQQGIELDNDTRAKILELSPTDSISMLRILRSEVITTNEEILNICNCSQRDGIPVVQSLFLNHCLPQGYMDIVDSANSNTDLNGVLMQYLGTLSDTEILVLCKTLKTINNTTVASNNSLDAQTIEALQTYIDAFGFDGLTVDTIVSGAQSLCINGVNQDDIRVMLREVVMGTLCIPCYDASQFSTIESLAEHLGVKICLINDDGTLKVDEMKRFEKSLNNYSVRVLYKYNESLMRQMLDKKQASGMSVEQLSLEAYTMRNNLRVLAQRCMVIQLFDSGLATGTVPYNSRYETCVLGKLFKYVTEDAADDAEKPLLNSDKVKLWIAQRIKANGHYDGKVESIPVLQLVGRGAQDTEMLPLYLDDMQQVYSELVNISKCDVTQLSQAEISDIVQRYGLSGASDVEKLISEVNAALDYAYDRVVKTSSTANDRIDTTFGLDRFK